MWIALIACSAETKSPEDRDREPDVPEARLLLSPSSLTFGTESAADVFTIRSIDDLPVNLESVLIEGSTAFSLTDPGPTTLAPHTAIEVTVAFAATGAEEEASVVIASDAVYAPHTLALAGAITGPVAVCTVDPVAIVPLDGATWGGRDSYDPGGRSLTSYDWTLVERPVGSVARLSSGGADVSFSPDLAGTYVAELVVTNDAGVTSDPCEVALEVTPTDHLWIELYWGESGDDMDLHLLAPGGTLRSDRDCYFGNCTYGELDWGAPRSDDDDPRLDLDDIPGTGPEAITLPAPEEGAFTVYVHDFPGSVYEAGNDVTLNLYVLGVLAWTETRAMEGEDVYEPFATVTFPDGLVTPL